MTDNKAPELPVPPIQEPSALVPPALAPPGNPDVTQVTCDVLCSLGTSSPSPQASESEPQVSRSGGKSKGKNCGSKGCKTSQLPMFLSKTYHMIDRCDPEIATWSDSGDNFVVKNVEKFASTVLPQYFKHSNFSSFARQLNFYGFRKLKAEPILTADYDARTACYVRFFHEKFQKDRPDLLQGIKRATKSDMHAKDDVESLKAEVQKLKECYSTMSTDFDRKLAEISYEYNRRITALSAEYDKLALLVQQAILGKAGEPLVLPNAGQPGVPDLMRSLSQAASMSLQTTAAPAAPSLAGLAMPNAETAQQPTAAAADTNKRPAEEVPTAAAPPAASRPRAV